jgi:calcium/calmodulin-dependent protein kinase I
MHLCGVHPIAPRAPPQDHDIEDMVREFQMLRALRHKNIVRLYAAYETPRRLYLVTELATGGELMKRLGSDHNTYSEDAVRAHVMTILHAVNYMHSENCVHRDLKPENVLLSDPSPNAEIKIVDLGLSRFFEERKLMRTICGTHKYLAPEIVRCDRGQQPGYDKAIDMWGVGLLTFIMLFGFNPFAREKLKDTHNSIVKGEFNFPEGYTVSDKPRDFVLQLLQLKAADRGTAAQALSHTWFCPTAPPSPMPIQTSDGKTVKQKLHEFNAQRSLSKGLKSAYRRLSGSTPGETPLGPSPVAVGQA